MQKIAILVPLIVLSFAFQAVAQYRQNVDKNGLMLKGYDAVAYFTENKAVKGNPQFTHTYKEAVYHFSSAANRDLFKNDPEKYAPQFGGYCGYAVSQGSRYDVDPRYFVFAEGKLVLQYDGSALAKWKKDPNSNEKAKKNWEKLKKV